MKSIEHSCFNPLSTPQDGKCAEVVLTFSEPRYKRNDEGQFVKVIEYETQRFIVTLDNLRKMAEQFNIVAEQYEKEGEG